MLTTINWTEVKSTGKKDVNSIIEYLKESRILMNRMSECDMSYRINDNYEYLRTPASDLSQYSIDSEDDLEFTMNIDGTHYIIGRVIIYSKLYSHRRLTFLVALPQESTDRYYYTEVENFRW